MKELTAFQRDTLHVVNRLEDPHGLAIKDQLESYYGKDVNHGRLYPNLNDLSEKSLIKVGTKDKRTNKYTLTQKGREKIRVRKEWTDIDESKPATDT